MNTEDKPGVLIVDDSKVNLDYLIAALGSEYKIGVALNGDTALKLAVHNHPDLILLDIVMPGMDGFEVCRELKKNPHTRMIPILFISAMEDDDSKNKMYDSGAEDYIPKPFNLKEVQKRVQTYLSLSAPTDKALK